MEMEMEMEVEVVVEGEDGSKLEMGKGEKIVFGRGNGFDTHDRTVSRQHVFFQLSHSDSDTEVPRVSFHVTGKNPLWVWSCTQNALSLFSKFQNGHLQFGDRFCFSPHAPVWFLFKIKPPSPPFNLQFHASNIDPVQEFGFLEMGHEFDQYPKGMIRNVKNWEWFIEEARKDEEDEEEKGRRMKRRKRRRGEEKEDEEWSGESEDDKDLVSNIRKKGKLPGYSTRSKDTNARKNKNSKQKQSTSVDETEEEDDGDETEEEDDGDETLGGFIVTDEEEEEFEEEEEEEEFDEEEENGED